LQNQPLPLVLITAAVCCLILQWYTAGAWTGNTWVGQVTMYCSDGTEVTIDAQPDFNPGWADGTVTQLSGFPTVSLMSGWALDSLFGVGAQSGGENTFACPSGMVVTGIAGGASPDAVRIGKCIYSAVCVACSCSEPFVCIAVAVSTGCTRKVANRGFAALLGLFCTINITRVSQALQSIRL
jgi:hypothetical protein